jgi:hypothetical protein
MTQCFIKQKVGSLKKISKINKPLAKLTKRRKEKTQINKIRHEKEDIVTDTNEIQIIWEYFENLYSSKLENQENIIISTDAKKAFDKTLVVFYNHRIKSPKYFKERKISSLRDENQTAIRLCIYHECTTVRQWEQCLKSTYGYLYLSKFSK